MQKTNKKIGSIVRFTNPDFNYKIGTTDKKHSDVIYYEGGFYIKPKNETEDHKQEIQLIKNTIGHSLHEQVKQNTLFDENLMCFIEVADEWIKYGKKSYVSFQIFLKLNNEVLEKSPHFNDIVGLIKKNNIDTTFMKHVFEEYGYAVSKSKNA